MSSGPLHRTPEETKRLALKGCVSLSWVIGAALLLTVLFVLLIRDQIQLDLRVSDLEGRVKELEKKQR